MGLHMARKKEMSFESALERLEEIARCRPAGIILREKDLAEAVWNSAACAVVTVILAIGKLTK